MERHQSLLRVSGDYPIRGVCGNVDEEGEVHVGRVSEGLREVRRLTRGATTREELEVSF